MESHDSDLHAQDKPAYRIPVGMPLRDEGRRTGAVISVVLHALVIGLLVVPFFMPQNVIERMQQGAGGAGPAGGGGGGARGGPATPPGYKETLRYVRLAPQPVPTPTTIPPVPAPVVPPVVPKVEPAVVPPPTPAAKVPEQAAAPAPAPATSAGTGAGAGSGTDGSAGNGPGSGGGTGSGVGTGRGSSTGPGTGGGTQANFSPAPIEFFLPPLPAPNSVKGFQLLAEFDVDSTGRVLDVKFTETRDGGYNRRLGAVLRSMKFRPGTRPDGTPLRMKAQLTYDF